MKKAFYFGLILAVITALLIWAPALACKEQSSETVRGVDGGLTSPVGTGIADRQFLGLFSHNWKGDFKDTVPSSAWPHVRNVRLEVVWGEVEGGGKKGTFDWSRPDREISAALSLGIDSILVTLTGPIPNWAADPNTPINPRKGPPANLKDFYDFCYQVANRYKDVVDYWQVWNEAGYDLDAPPAAEGIVYFYGYCDLQYMGMLRAGYEAVKKADPSSMMFTSSLLNGLSGDSASDLSNYEFLLNGGGQDLSMKVTSDKAIVAERPMYFNYHGAWAGGHNESGKKSPKKEWYLAEGATHPGFEEWITIQNPSASTANVAVTYMFPGGATQSQQVSVGPDSRYTIDVNGAVGPYKDVSARLVSNVPIVVERPMYFNYHNMWPGGSVEAGVNEMSDTWYLAEGTTNPGFEQWISLMNPNSSPTDVKITYMFEGGGTQEQTVNMAATSRETVMVNEIVGPNKNVSARVVANQPIIAERPMYFNYHGAWPGGHTEVGSRETATSWFLSEGTTRNNPDDGMFEEWISIQNPGGTDAVVDITYMFPGGETQAGQVVVGSRSRKTINVNEEVGPDRDVSVQLDSDRPIVVERPMYFNYHNSYAGGHVDLAARSSGKEWYFAEGTTRAGFEEWLTLQNPSTSSATATITFMFSDGITQDKVVSLPPQSRTTVGVNRSVSISTVSDALSIHPYRYPPDWAPLYGALRDLRASMGFGDMEVVVSEIGWPHEGLDPNFSMEGQREAIGEVGVGGLWAAGCKKIWIYEDIDDPPGKSWEGNYDGLFTHDGSATPAWNEYMNWQSQLQDYGNLPDHW